MTISGELFKQIGRSAASPVCIVAAYDRHTGAIVALTVSSFVTLSFNPPMVMFAIQQSADSYDAIASSEAFGVSLLHQSQSEVATLFSTKGREKIDRTVFAHGSTLRCPLIPDALAHVECATDQILRSGDHAIVVGIVKGASIRSAGDPLLYFGRKYGTFVPL
jgi:flavin reductase (DIM6/NTAB) family NADH-FMN oxidoreductase RutF